MKLDNEAIFTDEEMLMIEKSVEMVAKRGREMDSEHLKKGKGKSILGDVASLIGEIADESPEKKKLVDDRLKELGLEVTNRAMSIYTKLALYKNCKLQDE